MSGPDALAARLGDALKGRTEGPWEIYAERARRFELHLAGDRIEMRRGPIEVEGFGLRLFRPAARKVGVGFAASTDCSEASVRLAAEEAERTGPLAPSPAQQVELPAPIQGALPSVQSSDPTLTKDPEAALESYVRTLLEPVGPRPRVVPSFGSVRASLVEVSIANSLGLSSSYARTMVDLEFAVQTGGGAEGRPPAEYWVTRRLQGVPSSGVASEVQGWCRRAEDTGRAVLPPTDLTELLIPPEILADVLPPILGFRLGGEASLRKMAPVVGSAVAFEGVQITDDGLRDGASASAPVDEEGSPRRSTPLIRNGKAEALLYDRIHAAALGASTTGNGSRDSTLFPVWLRFTAAPSVEPTTLVLAHGDGGTDAELAESVGEGILLDQLGYAFPDAETSAFGGEIRLAYRIRGGKIAEPLRGGTVGGFTFGPAPTPPLLPSIVGLGSSVKLVGRLSAPTIRVRGFPIASGA
jgi:TldD protein